MTILSGNAKYSFQDELSSRPERSGAEGSAVRPSGFPNSGVPTQTLWPWIFEASAKAHNQSPTLFRNAEALLPSAKAEGSHQDPELSSRRSGGFCGPAPNPV